MILIASRFEEDRREFAKNKIKKLKQDGNYTLFISNAIKEDKVINLDSFKKITEYLKVNYKDKKLHLFIDYFQVFSSDGFEELIQYSNENNITLYMLTWIDKQGNIRESEFLKYSDDVIKV